MLVYYIRCTVTDDAAGVEVFGFPRTPHYSDTLASVLSDAVIKMKQTARGIFDKLCIWLRI